MTIMSTTVRPSSQTAVNLKVIGIADVAAGDAARAVLMFVGAAAIEQTAGESWHLLWLEEYNNAVAAAEATVGARFTELWEAGLAMADSDVIKIALRAPLAELLPRLRSQPGGTRTPRSLAGKPRSVS